MAAAQLPAQGFENVILLDNWQDSSLPVINNGIRYNEVWGFVQNGEEYAVMGSTMGTHIFRITDDNQLDSVAFVPGAFQGQVVHRDYHDYEGYLYAVCDQGQSTLQIIDLSGLPESVEVVYDSNEWVVTAHNVFIDSATAKLYLAGPSGTALLVLSVENPTAPEFLFYFFGVNYVHDLYVRNDTAWLNAANQGLWVIDFGGEEIEMLGTLTEYEDQGYNHSGWLSADGNTYVFADETDGMRMKVCNVEDLSNIEVQGLFGSEVSANSVAHNLQMKDQLVYVSHYNDGLQVFDVSNPNEPERVAWYDTFTGDESYSFNGAWGIYAFLPSGRILISDRTSGLYLFQMDLTTGVDDRQDAAQLKLYPNPTTGVVTLESNLNAPEEVVLYNFAGQVVARIAGGWIADEAIVFDTGHLPAGMYVIELRSRGEVIRENLIRF